MPLVDRVPDEAPPLVVAIVGPPGVSFLHGDAEDENVPDNIRFD